MTKIKDNIIYQQMGSCKREVIYSIHISKNKVTPLGAIEHPKREGVYYCSFIKNHMDTDSDKGRCLYLGDLIEVNGWFRYRCKALDNMMREGLRWK